MRIEGSLGARAPSWEPYRPPRGITPSGRVYILSISIYLCFSLCLCLSFTYVCSSLIPGCPPLRAFVTPGTSRIGGLASARTHSPPRRSVEGKRRDIPSYGGAVTTKGLPGCPPLRAFVTPGLSLTACNPPLAGLQDWLYILQMVLVCI